MSNPLTTPSNTIRSNLINECTKANLMPFVGAGFSCNISTKAAFRCFFQDRLKFLIPDILLLLNLFKGNTAKALEYAVWLLSKRDKATQGHTPNDHYDYGKKELRDSIVAQIREASLDNVPNGLWEQHLLLVKRFKHIFTTNWDSTLENACKNQNLYHEFHYSVNGVLQRTRWGNGQEPCRIIKYHGHSAVAESLIATESDYHCRIRRSDPIDDELIYHYSQKGFLFIGYSLTDINVRYALNQINHLNRYFDRVPPSYMVSVDPVPTDTAKKSAYEQMCQFIYECSGITTYHLVDWSQPDHKEWVFGNIDHRLEEKAFPVDPNEWESSTAKKARQKLNKRDEKRRIIIQAAWINLLKSMPEVIY